jgi:chromosome segregation ATPase
MALSDYLILQHYLTVILLIIAAVLWYKLKQSADISQLRGSRMYSTALLLTLPFLISVITFIPDQIEVMLKQLLLLLIFILLAVAGIRSYREAFKERKDLLRELYEGAEKHPIRLEFAKHIVEPEIHKIMDVKEKHLLERKSLQAKERALIHREEQLQKKVDRLENLHKQLKEQEAKLVTMKQELKEKERSAGQKIDVAAKKQSELQATQQRQTERDARYAEKIKALDQKEAKLHEEYSTMKAELKKKFDQLILEQRESLKKQTTKQDLYVKEREDDLKKYREELNQRKDELHKKRKEVDDMKQELVDIKEERSYLQREREKYQTVKEDALSTRTKLKKEQHDFEKDRSDVLALQESVKRHETKLKRREEDLRKDIERLREREAEAKRSLEEARRGKDKIKPFSEPHSIVWTTADKKDKKTTNKTSSRGGIVAELKSHVHHVLDLFGF